MKNLVGVFHSDDVSRFMQQFDVSMKQKQSPYTFVILTTERAVEEKEHWWSFLDLDPPIIFIQYFWRYQFQRFHYAR